MSFMTALINDSYNICLQYAYVRQMLPGNATARSLSNSSYAAVGSFPEWAKEMVAIATAMAMAIFLAGSGLPFTVSIRIR
jgi:hypothetical protein